MTQEFGGGGVEHPLVRDYLERLRGESTRLPADDAHELFGDIREHLRTALGDRPTEAQVREQLDRVGSPAQLVDEAAGVQAAPRPGRRTSRPPTRPGALGIAAVVCLLAAESVFILSPLLPLGLLVWLVGLVLLGTTPAWTRGEKLLGYLSLGTGYPVALLLVVALGSVDTGGGSTTPWLTDLIGLFALAFLGWQGWTIWRLFRRRR